MNYQLDRNELRNAYYQKLIGAIIGECTDQPARLCGSLAHKIGVTFDSQRAHLEAQPPSYMKAMMESLMDAVENGVENYYVEHAGVFRTSQEQIDAGVAMEAAVEDMDSQDGGSELGSVLSDFLSSMQNFSPAQIKDMAKLVLQLEQDNQNQAKDEALAENDEVEENTEATEDPFGEGGDKGKDDTNAEEGNEADPFGGDEGDAFAESGSGDGSDPFGGDAQSSGDEDPFGSGDDGSDPFGDGGSDSDSQEKGDEESSEESSDNNEGGDSKEAFANDQDSQNPFESIQQVSLIQLKNGKKPFLGLENGDLSNFCVVATKGIFKDKMKNVFEKFGVESAEYQDIVAKYKKTNRVLMESTIATIGMCSLLGLRPNMDMIKFPDLYEEDFK